MMFLPVFVVVGRRLYGQIGRRATTPHCHRWRRLYFINLCTISRYHHRRRIVHGQYDEEDNSNNNKVPEDRDRFIDFVVDAYFGIVSMLDVILQLLPPILRVVPRRGDKDDGGASLSSVHNGP
jgi:hypothetical protein